MCLFALTAGFGTDQASHAETIAQQSAITEGVTTTKRFKLGKEKGEIDTNQIITSDQRCFTISASNKKLVKAMASRALQVPMTGAGEDDGRSRSECATIDNRNKDYKAAVLALKLGWALHHKYWIFKSVINFKIVETFGSVFYGLCRVVYGRSYVPQPRYVTTLGKIAMASMVNRITMKWYQQHRLGLTDASFFTYIRQHSCILFRDYMLAHVMLDKLTFTGVQDSIVLKTFKEHIITKAIQVGVPTFEMFDTIYVVTSLKTQEDVSARTNGFAQSSVVVANAIGRLTQPYGESNQPALVTVGGGAFNGHFAVAVKAVCQPHIRTIGEGAILNFLRDTVSALRTKQTRVCQQMWMMNLAWLGWIPRSLTNALFILILF
jgi:hypothetical protein